MRKPKLWKYKSGKNKGKLRPKAKEYLSYQAKQYYETGLTASEREERNKVKGEQKDFLKTFIDKKGIKKRLRYQIAYNSDYSVSVRAIVINPSDGKEEHIQMRLEQAIQEHLENEKVGNVFGDDGEGDWWNTEGLEKKYISEDEDKSLIDDKVYVEENIKGYVNYIQL